MNQMIKLPGASGGECASGNAGWGGYDGCGSESQAEAIGRETFRQRETRLDFKTDSRGFVSISSTGLLAIGRSE